MKFVDLHVHSNASDGTFTPSEVVALAVEKDLAAIALTDHDTIDGLSEAQAAAAGLPIEIIPGIELSCVYQGEEIHILGIYVDPTDRVFISETAALKEIRKKRNEEMIRRFQNAGISITLDEVMAGNPDTVITRAHFARVLLEKGYVKNMDQAFKKYDLFPTGGSDFHGSNKPDISLGVGRGGLRITALLLDDIKRIRREKGL